MPVRIRTIHEALATWPWSWNTSVSQSRRSANAHSDMGKEQSYFLGKELSSTIYPSHPFFILRSQSAIATGAAILRPLPTNNRLICQTGQQELTWTGEICRRL